MQYQPKAVNRPVPRLKSLGMGIDWVMVRKSHYQPENVVAAWICSVFHWRFCRNWFFVATEMVLMLRCLCSRSIPFFTDKQDVLAKPCCFA